MRDLTGFPLFRLNSLQILFWTAGDNFHGTNMRRALASTISKTYRTGVVVLSPTLYAIVQFDGAAWPALIFAGFAIIQLTISNVLYPYLQGKSLALSPVGIVVALAFWGWLWGIAGALIAVPLTATLVIVCDAFDQTRWIARALAR